jgi:1-deoxy-D-xylulose 5-phosphate reductoisomerase
MINCVSILGSTGSIGRQSLDIIDNLGIRVAALTAGTSVERMAEQCRKYRPQLAVMATKEAADARKTVKVPDLTGKTAAAANGTLISQRLNIKISGANISVTNRSAVVYEQFPAAGEEVYEGTVVELYFRFLDGSDQTYYDPDADIGEEDKE